MADSKNTQTEQLLETTVSGSVSLLTENRFRQFFSDFPNGSEGWENGKKVVFYTLNKKLMNKNTNQAKALVKTDIISSFSNLDEAAQRYSDDWENITGLEYEDEYPEAINKLDFINGAKWQQKQNLKDMQEYAEFCIICDRKEMPLLLAEDWYEHYKK